MRRIPIEIFTNLIINRPALGNQNETILRDLTVQILSLMIDCTDTEPDY